MSIERVHHLSCGTFCPLGGPLLNRHGSALFARLVCHCLLIETRAHGLVLVDTGLGLNDVARPHPRLNRGLCLLTGLRLKASETAAAQVEALGFRRDDVRHIVLTHLDFDHAGGLDDFPDAQVHVMAEELTAARDRRGLIARGRYRPDQFERELHWNRYEPGGEPWNGFAAVRQLNGLPPEILLIPLAGHTLGHAGVAIETGAGPLLHAGDAYFHSGELHGHCPPGLRIYQSLLEADRRQRLANQARLRALSREQSSVQIFCAHDPGELQRFQSGTPYAIRANSNPRGLLARNCVWCPQFTRSGVEASPPAAARAAAPGAASSPGAARRRARWPR